MKRLMVYSQDGMGLGHMRRTFNIARAVLARVPGCAVLIVSDSPAAPFFAPLPGMDYLKLPTVVKTGTATWRSGGLPLDVDQTMRLRAGLILEAFREFRPDTVLVDHMPVGALGELAPMLEHATDGHDARPMLFLGLRDVLDEPDVVRRTWSELDGYRYLERYDAVLVYGSRDVFDAAAAYDLHPHARRLVYCSYVVSPPAAGPAEPPSPGHPLIAVMGGGGADAFPLAAAFLEALPIVRREAPVRGVILAGPNMPDSQRRQLVARADGHPVEVSDGYHDALPWLRRASAVVTMAGYNSLCESLRERKKALAVPRAGPSQEQRIRSRLFADRQLLAVLEPEALTPERLAAELLALLGEDGIPDRASIPQMDGAELAAAQIVDGMRSQEGEQPLVSVP